MENFRFSLILYRKKINDAVAFKLEYNNIICKSKLSQNREIQDFIS